MKSPPPSRTHPRSRRRSLRHRGLRSASARLTRARRAASVAGAYLLGRDHAMLAEHASDDEMALLIEPDDPPHEGLALTANLHPAAREDISVAPAGENGCGSVRPEAMHPPLEGVEVIRGESAPIDLSTCSRVQGGSRLRGGPQGHAEGLRLDIQVHADAEDQVLDRSLAKRALDERASNLAAVDEHVVWPLDDRLRSELRDRIGRRQPGDEGKDGSLGYRQRAPKEHRGVEIDSGRREPRLTHAATSGRLRIGQHHRALWGAREGKLPECRVGRGNLTEEIKLTSHRRRNQPAPNVLDRKRPGAADIGHRLYVHRPLLV